MHVRLQRGRVRGVTDTKENILLSGMHKGFIVGRSVMWQSVL